MIVIRMPDNRLPHRLLYIRRTHCGTAFSSLPKETLCRPHQNRSTQVQH